MPATGEKIGRYLRLEPIGRGGAGVVYRAKDPLIHRAVAVKVLHPARGLDPDQIHVIRERFRREAQAAGNIDHPHIVRIFDVGEGAESGELFIVMEHLPGGSLEDRIGAGSLDLDTSVEIIGQIASALDAAHERDIVHRDVKPSNILFTERGAAKIADFGITQIASSSLTQDLSRLGTPAYMSPEQVAGRPLDARADLFSLGVLSYEVLTGTKPFTGGDVVAIAHAIAHEDPVRISVANRALPQALDRVFALMMAKEPADRFASGAAFHAAIVRCLKEHRPVRPGPRVLRARHRAQIMGTLAACGLVAAVAFSIRSGRAPAAAPPAAPAAAAPVRHAAPKAAKPLPVTTKATISLTHRIRDGRLVVSVDGASILNEGFSKGRLAITQTTVWDPVQVAAGKHSVQAKVIGGDGTTYLSETYAVDFPRSSGTTIRIKMKGDKLVVLPS